MLEKICKILSTIIMFVLLIIAVLLIGPKLLGYQGYAVLSGSMEPQIHVGSIVYDKQVDVSELEAGDVVTYRLSGDTLVTHRVVSVDNTAQEVITKGDANDVEDGSPVPFSEIVGEMAFCIPYLGFISIYGKTKLGIGIICAILVVLIVINFLPEVFKEDEDKKKKVEEKE